MDPDSTTTEQQVRVTDPGPETTPARQKDPKKVAAGRAGAAARKKNQDSLKEERDSLQERLRQVKEARRRPENNSEAPPEVRPAEPAEKAAPAVDSTTSWAIGAAVVGLGLAYWAASKRAPVDFPVLPPENPPVLSPDVGSAQQLKVRRDPFHME